MMFKHNILFTLLFILSIFSLPVKAQEQNTLIEYGQSAAGKITNKNFEVAFDFKAKKGEVFIIEMNSDQPSDFGRPEIIVLNSDGDVEGDSRDNSGYGSAFFVSEISKDDTLTILASRRNGRSGDGEGDFTLSLSTPILLNVGEALNDSTISEVSKYYLINKGKDDMSLTYKKSDGDFSPEISINMINDSYGLDRMIFLGGEGLTEVQAKLPDQQGAYIVKVTEALFDFNFKEVKATYQLQISSNKSA